MATFDPGEGRQSQSQGSNEGRSNDLGELNLGAPDFNPMRSPHTELESFEGRIEAASLKCLDPLSRADIHLQAGVFLLRERQPSLCPYAISHFIKANAFSSDAVGVSPLIKGGLLIYLSCAEILDGKVEKGEIHQREGYILEKTGNQEALKVARQKLGVVTGVIEYENSQTL